MAGRTDTFPFKDRLGLLHDELALAARWNATIILLAVFRSEIIHQKAANSLRHLIRLDGGAVMHLSVTQEDHDIPIILRDHPDWSGNIFFIDGLSRGSGRGYSNAYRALNMHREYLVDLHLRCVFWITESEFKKLPRLAPDFWAFRHKVVEFPDLPLKTASQPSIPGGDYASMIKLHQQKLKREPGNARLHADLGGIFQAAGCYEEALSHYKKASRLAPGNKRTLQALIQLYAAMGQVKLAQRLQESLRADRSNGAVRTRRGTTRR